MSNFTAESIEGADDRFSLVNRLKSLSLCFTMPIGKEAADEIERLQVRVKELAAFRSAVIGWRESDWSEGFCRHTAESIAQHGKRYEESARLRGGGGE